MMSPVIWNQHLFLLKSMFPCKEKKIVIPLGIIVKSYGFTTSSSCKSLLSIMCKDNFRWALNAMKTDNSTSCLYTTNKMEKSMYYSITVPPSKKLQLQFRLLKNRKIGESFPLSSQNIQLIVRCRVSCIGNGWWVDIPPLGPVETTMI